MSESLKPSPFGLRSRTGFKKVRVAFSISPEIHGKLKAAYHVVREFHSVSDMVDQFVDSPHFDRFLKGKMPDVDAPVKEYLECEIKSLAIDLAKASRQRKVAGRRGYYHSDSEGSDKYMASRAIRDCLKAAYPSAVNLKFIQNYLVGRGFQKGTSKQNISMQIKSGRVLKGLTRKTRDGWVYVPETRKGENLLRPNRSLSPNGEAIAVEGERPNYELT
tara:strand:+ start:82 stop:735 length:654 start_codon:yes stop_codon:yes gene_type:complete